MYITGNFINFKINRINSIWLLRTICHEQIFSEKRFVFDKAYFPKGADIK